MPDPSTPRTSLTSAAAWLAIIGAAAGIIVGTLMVIGLTASGVTSASLPPLPSPELTSTPTPVSNATPSPTPSSAVPQPTLTTENTRVAPGERFDLTGQMPGLKAGELQVQVKDGSGPWTDFPVTASVKEDGTFHTEIYTTRTGTRTFRLTDKSSGKSTPTLKITIG